LSERVVGIARLVGQAESMVKESGEGRGIVSDLLARMQSGVYA
jgi:hypothetical protein